MKRIICLFGASVFAFSALCFSACKEEQKQPEKQAVSNDTLYLNAVNDSIIAETSEIFPLVNLVAGDKYANVQNGKVLLITFHHYPDSYKVGTVNENIGYYMWTFTDKEIIAWYKNNNENVEDWHLRFCQLLGMSETSTNTYFSGVWADLDDVIRPAYETDITKQMRNSFASSDDTDYINWFNGNFVYSYSSETLAWRNPWTRLGYSYDWADNGKEYGLSEFLIKKGATVQVEFTYNIEEFLEYLGK